jgi:hypothetical protein
MDFEVLVNSVPAAQSVFTTPESTLAYFDDQALDLGASVQERWPHRPDV